MKTEIFKIECEDQFKNAPKILFATKEGAIEYLVEHGFIQEDEPSIFFKITDGWFEDQKLIHAKIKSLFVEHQETL